MSNPKDIKSAVAEWAPNGAEWCAKKLFEARQELHKIRLENKHSTLYECKRYRLKSALSERVMEENSAMAEVLEKNGIRPTFLRCFYVAKPCEDCDREECHYYECEDEAEYVDSIAWYLWRIKDGTIEGVLTDFSSKSLDCYKIIDEKTGKVLYQSREIKSMWKETK